MVLAGGLSPERQVSLVSGQSICRALRELGHRAVLVDMFLGLEGQEDIFSGPAGPLEDEVIRAQEPDLEAVRRQRGDRSPSLFGPGVLDACARADAVFLGLHGECGEDGRVQAAFDLLGIPYTGSGHLASGMAMNKAVTKQVMERLGIPSRLFTEITMAGTPVGFLKKELADCVSLSALLLYYKKGHFYENQYI